jgi:hypothetical protein
MRKEDRWACKECLVRPACKQICQRTKLYSDICYEACSEQERFDCAKQGYIISCGKAETFKRSKINLMEGL